MSADEAARLKAENKRLWQALFHAATVMDVTAALGQGEPPACLVKGIQFVREQLRKEPAP